MEILITHRYRLFELFNLRIRVNIVLRLCKYIFVHDLCSFVMLVFATILVIITNLQKLKPLRISPEIILV